MNLDEEAMAVSVEHCSEVDADFDQLSSLAATAD